MAPTICSDKKQQTQRSAGISNLRRQARGLQRSNVPTASIINYVSKGVIAQLRQRTNSTTSNSSESSEIDLSGSATSNRRLQEQDQQQQLMRQQNEHHRQHREQQQHHHHQRHQHHNHPTDEAEATHSSRSQISDSAVSTSLPASPSPSPSTSTSSTSLPSPMSGLSAGHIVYINNNNNAEHHSQNSLNDYRVYSPHNTLSEGSMSPYQDEEERNLFYDADMEDAASSFNYIHNDYDVDDDFDTHSIASDFSDVAIDLSAHDFQHRQPQQQQQQQRSNRNHQTVFNAPAFGDKQQHISVICSTNTTTTNSNNSNRNTNNNNNHNNTTNYNNHNTTTTTTKTICSDLLHNSRDVNYDLCEGKNTEGLLSIAIKTIKLVKRNQLLQRRLQQLQQETSEFIKSVMANPENRHYREKLEQKQQPPPLKQQRAE